MTNTDAQLTSILEDVYDEDTDETTDALLVDPTDDELRELFPNPAGFFVAKVALESHAAYVDAHTATFPDEVNVRENAWRKPFTAQADRMVEAGEHYGPFVDVMTTARTSEDPSEVAYILAFADALKQAAKDNLRGLYLASRSTRTVTTDAVDSDTLKQLLNDAERNVTALIGLTHNGMADIDAIWSILPSKARKVRVAKGAKDTGAVRKSYGPPLIPSTRILRSNNSKLRLVVNGETVDAQVGEALKSHVGMPLSEVSTKYFGGKFTTENLNETFTHNGQEFSFTTVD